MTRLMGDATHVNVPQLATVSGLQLAAGYVTGTPDIRWVNGDWARFYPGIQWVTIDQGYQSPPTTTAIVRDVETGAWSAADAVRTESWTPAIGGKPARKTIYCNRNDLVSVLATGWQGDLWLAIPGWFQGDPLPSAPGCTVVAVQNNFSNPAYDLSVVLDPTWPLGDPMNPGIVIPGIDAIWLLPPSFFIGANGDGFCYGVGLDGNFWLAKRPAGQPWGHVAPM